MTQLNSNEWWFFPLFRVAGYALLALSLIDIIYIFVPPRFTDPAWEFQMAVNLVERAPVPLLGLVLVFSSEKNSQILKFLSWASLVVGVLFVLLVPFGISSSVRLDQQNQFRISAQLNQQAAPVKQLKDQLTKATTDNDVEQVLRSLNPQAPVQNINNPQQVKSRLLAEIAQAEKKANAQVEANRTNARQPLIKNAIKSLLGAAVSGAVFLLIWSQTSKILKVNRQRR